LMVSKFPPSQTCLFFFTILLGNSASYKMAAAKYRDLCNNYLFFS
jgi:hypothetical protein